VFYAGAELFASLVGWDPLRTIIGIGLFVVLYTTFGGMKAVIATDVMQAAILVIGIGAVMWKVLAVCGYDPAAIYRFAAEHGRGYEALTSAKFYRLDFHERFNIWLLAWLVLIVPIASLSSDQLVVQRLLTGKGYAGAKRAVFLNYWMSIPLVMMFWVVGVGLFYHYNAPGGARLPAGMSNDRVMGYFIATELPPPIPGLIIAALLAALMSTISSVVNSIATVIYRDGLVRMKLIDHAPHKEVLAAKILSVLAGLSAIGIAVLMVLGGKTIKSSVLEVNFIWQGLGYLVAGSFVVGVLLPRVGGTAMFIGLVVGATLAMGLPYFLYYSVAKEQRISFYWITVPSVLATILVPLALSFVWPSRKPLAGLTLWTLPQRPAQDSLGGVAAVDHKVGAGDVN
jgi:Na+/proline symporter